MAEVTHAEIERVAERAAEKALVLAEMEKVAERAAEKALVRMMLVLGVDANDPKAMIKFQENLAMLRRWGEATETVKSAGLKSAIGVMVTAALALVWLGIRAKLGLPAVP